MAISRLKLEALELVSGEKGETPDLWNPGVTTQSSECFQWEFLTELKVFPVKEHGQDKAWMKPMYIHIRTWKHQDKVDSNICVVESFAFQILGNGRLVFKANWY